MSGSRIEAADDGLHPAGPDPAWSESWYFAWFSDERSGIARMANRPNEGTQDALVVDFASGAVHTGTRSQPHNTDELATGGVAFLREAPLERWHITRDDGSLELRFTAQTPAGEAWMEGERGAVGRVASGHFEQAGAMEGSIGGERFAGRGYRDKSWGVRDWAAPDLWRWFCLPFGPDLSVNALIVQAGGRRFAGGWAWTGGELVPVSSVELDTELGGDGIAHEALELRCRVGGEAATFSASIEALVGLPLPTDRGTLVNEGLARWTDGEGRTTLGIAEYLHQGR